MMVADQVVSMETSLPAASTRPLWHSAQFPEPEKWVVSKNGLAAWAVATAHKPRARMPSIRLRKWPIFENPSRATVGKILREGEKGPAARLPGPSSGVRGVKSMEKILVREVRINERIRVQYMNGSLVIAIGVNQ